MCGGWKAIQVVQIRFFHFRDKVSFTFLPFSLEGALFLLCPWFSHEVFYTVTSFNAVSEDIRFHCLFFSAAVAERHNDHLLLSFLPFSFASSVQGEVSHLDIRFLYGGGRWCRRRMRGTDRDERHRQMKDIPMGKLAIAHLKYGTSVGPDDISYTTLLHFNEAAPLLLPNLFTACLTSSVHPPEWKMANCVVVPKPGKKSYSQPKSYRPISLL